MFAKYQYLSGSPSLIANVLDDIVAIATGTTDVNTLSVSCDKANTTILSTVAAGWVLHDAASSTTSRVIKAPYVDDPTKFKYLQILFNSSSYLTLNCYEDFNAITHTGTNVTTNANNQYQLINAGCQLYLWIKPRYFVCVRQCGSSYGDNSSGPTMCVEYSRISPWNTVSSGYPAFAYVNVGYSLAYGGTVSVPRAKSNTGADLTGTNALCNILSIGATYNSFTNVSEFPSGATAKERNEAGELLASLIPFILVKQILLLHH